MRPITTKKKAENVARLRLKKQHSAKKAGRSGGGGRDGN